MKRPEVVPNKAGVAKGLAKTDQIDALDALSQKTETDRIRALNQEIDNGCNRLRDSFQHSGPGEASVSDVEKCLRSISYLLEWSSRNGNEKVEGFSAHGLSIILADAADEASRLFSQSDMFYFLKTSGKFSELREITAERYR